MQVRLRKLEHNKMMMTDDEDLGLRIESLTIKKYVLYLQIINYIVYRHANVQITYYKEIDLFYL